MRAGDVVRVDFGIPAGSEPGFERPAVIVTADGVLAHHPRTIHVVPVTSNVGRALPTEVVVSAPWLPIESAAQCHLCTVVSIERLNGDESGNVGAAALAQLRSVLADLLDIG
jgi:mRNA interferase MazF